MPLPHPPFHFSEMVSPPMCQQSLTHQVEAGPRPYPQYLGWARYLSVNNSCPDGLLCQMAWLKAVQCSSFAFFLRRYVSLTDNHICEVYQLTFSRCCTAEIMVQHLSEMKHCCWIQPRGKHLRAPKLQQFMTCSTWAFWGWLLLKWAEVFVPSASQTLRSTRAAHRRDSVLLVCLWVQLTKNWPAGWSMRKLSPLYPPSHPALVFTGEPSRGGDKHCLLVGGKVEVSYPEARGQECKMSTAWEERTKARSKHSFQQCRTRNKAEYFSLVQMGLSAGCGEEWTLRGGMKEECHSETRPERALRGFLWKRVTSAMEILLAL